MKIFTTCNDEIKNISHKQEAGEYTLLFMEDGSKDFILTAEIKSVSYSPSLNLLINFLNTAGIKFTKEEKLYEDEIRITTENNIVYFFDLNGICNPEY